MTDDAHGPGDSTAGAESLITVVVALAANGLLAVAKSAAALLTGSAAMVAEAAHSWSDTGNEVFLLVAERRGRRPRDDAHPRGYGRSTYLWAMVAAFGLFAAGAGVSIWTGISDLWHEPRAEGHFTLNYVILAVAALLEGTSFLQASRQVRRGARRTGLRPLRYVSRTSDPTVRAVFLEDAAALVGIAVAAAGIALHQVTDDARWDAIASIVIGLLLAAVAVFLLRRNMEFLLGVGSSPRLRSRVLTLLAAEPEVQRVTYLHLEFVGPLRLFVVAAVDLVGDDTEDHLAVRMRRVERSIEQDPLIEDAVLTLAQPDDPDLREGPGAQAGGVR